MSADPVFDLQAAIVPLLRADAALNGLIGGRVYDAVVPDAQFPYVSLGPATATTEDADDCFIGYEVELQIDVWARGSASNGNYEAARPQMQRVAGTLKQALHAAEMTLESHRLLQIRHAETLYQRAPDELTAHAVMTFRALVDQN